MPGQRSPDIVQINLRLPKDLHKRLKREADRAKPKRSLNQEMIMRLEQTFKREIADDILAQAVGYREAAEKLYATTFDRRYEAKARQWRIKREGKK